MSYKPSKQRKYEEKDQTEQTVIQKHSEFRSCTWKLKGIEGLCRSSDDVHGN